MDPIPLFPIIVNTIRSILVLTHTGCDSSGNLNIGMQKQQESKFQAHSFIKFDLHNLHVDLLQLNKEHALLK